MSQFFDVQIDLETMGLPPTGAIVSIGAVFFDYTERKLGPKFQRNVHLATSVRHGGTMDAGTVLWWLGQSDEARKVRFNGEDIVDVLNEFSDWISATCRVEDVRPWGNSASFDMTILETAYQRLGLKAPWYFGNVRDFRTVRNWHPRVEYNPADKGDEAHNALADAIFQAEHMFKIIDVYGGRFK